MDLTDEQWSILKPLVPEPNRRPDGKGRPWRDSRDIMDGNGLPVAINIASASPHEVTLAEAVVARCFVPDAYPARLIGDRAYDSDQLDYRLATEHGIELIAPHRSNRRSASTQDGRVLCRYKRRWKIERLFAWLQSFRRIQVRYDYYAGNFLGFVQLARMLILLGRCL